MQSTRSKLRSLAINSMAATVASALVWSSAQAAGLGRLTVLSSLGQPLHAEIELNSVSADEAGTLAARLANSESFRQANIDFNPALLSLRFTVEQRGGRQFIKVTSSQPLNEPFVDMLVELSWNNGRLVREYTFLLDPADMRTAQAASAAQAARPQAAPAAAPQAAPVRPAAPRPTPAPSQGMAATRPEPARESAPARPAASEYQVKPGDTLGKIAREVKPVEVSLDMMLVALYRANPDAFLGNNMNRLRSGQILTVPDTDAIKGTGEAEARGVVIAHAADFNAYRSKLAGQVAAAAPDRAPEARQSAAGRISARVQERASPASEAQDQLRLSKADTAGTAGTARNSGLAAEDVIAKEKALADANERVKELERNVRELEQLVQVKSRTGAEAQSAAQAPAPAPLPAPQAAKPAPEATKPAPVPPPIKTAPKPAAPPEPGIADFVMDNITLIGGGLAAALLALFGLSVARRRKAAKPPLDEGTPTEPSILGAPTDQPQSMFAETGGQSVDTNNSVFNSSFAPSASQLDTNEVDPVAEADVYIAYGRDAQAEEILKEALRTHPERHPVRLKLLEIYAARRDTQAFEAQATELYSHTRGGQGDEWAQAAALGLTIDPNNPLYAGASAPAPAALSQEQLNQQALLDQTVAEEAAALDIELADQPTAVPEPAPAPAPKVEDDHTLDFDLGGLTFEPIKPDTQPAAPAAAAAPAAFATAAAPEHELTFAPQEPAAAAPSPAPAQDNALDMAFDLDFAPAESKAESKAGPAVTPDEAFAAPAEANLADLNLGDLSLDLPGHDAKPSTAADATALDLSSEFSLDNLDDLTAEFADAASPAAAEEKAQAEAAASHPLHDLDALNFDLPGSDTPAAAAAAHLPSTDDELLAELTLPDLPGSAAAPASPLAVPEFDLSSIDLDLPATSRDTGLADEPALPDLGDIGAASAPIESAELSPEQMEMETKLDLAIAYQEIGDKEGARELLDEVLKGGNVEQVARANSLLTQLA